MTWQTMIANAMSLEWGYFSSAHLVTLVLAAVINIGLYIYLKNKPRKKQIGVLFTLSLVGLAAIIYDFFAFGSPWENLPLTLCSLTALLLPSAVLFRRKWSCNLLLLWSASSYIALVANYEMASVKIVSLTFFLHYFSLVFQAGIPILLFALKLVKRDYKTIKSTIVLTVACYTAVHFINVAINSAGLLTPEGNALAVNYMFSISPENPVLNAFWLLIPYEFWYMCLTLPAIILYLGWWYLPELLGVFKRKRRLRKKLRAVDRYYDEYYEEYVEEIIENDD